MKKSGLSTSFPGACRPRLSLIDPLPSFDPAQPGRLVPRYTGRSRGRVARLALGQ
jgi:hypothetical protein